MVCSFIVIKMEGLMMEKCIKKLMIAAILMGSLAGVVPACAMDGRGNREEEIKERESAPARQITCDEDVSTQ